MAKKLKELREMSDADLAKELAGLRSQLQDQRFSLAGRRLTRVRDVRDVKKGIARILTIQNERKLSAAKVEAPAKKVEAKVEEPKKEESKKEEAPKAEAKA